MNRNEILDAIHTLSKGQGFYCRVYNAIMEAENKDEILAELEKQNFKDMLDIVMYFEQ